LSETTIAEQPQRDSPAVGRAAEPITTPAESISAPVAPPARAPLTLPTRLRFIAANLGTFLLALVLSLFIWVAAVNEQNPPREDLYPLDIPIELINRPPSLVLTMRW